VRLSRFLIAAFFAASAAGLHAQSAKTAELGSITFPTSAKPAAQGPFLTGVKALYNFEFDTAAESFRAAQKADPQFALGYWGEAMSFNHPLWAQQDLAAARKVMERLAPTAAERAAKAPAGKERELIEAQEILFGAGDKLVRDIAYAQALEKMVAKYPADDEIKIMYALSLLGTARPGVNSARQSMQAAAIAVDVFQRHPSIPARRTSSSTRSTIPITRFWRCPRRAPTRRSRRPRRTPSTCRRTSSCSLACGTT
jgi:hypothetical protein